MVIAIVILSILLLFSVLVCVKMGQIVYQAVGTIDNLKQEYETMMFMEGIVDIPDEAIMYKFDDASLLCRTLPSEEGEVRQVFDTSLYMKNKVIGLTYFVPKQDLEEFKRNLQKDKELEKQLRRKLKLEGIEISTEELREILQQTPVINENSPPPIIPHCTVYCLKDGRWLWRQEE